MIKVVNLSKRFGNNLVIQNISFKIKRGEIVGLLGPNGAGKTTTLRMVAGVLPPSSGKIFIDDKNLLENDHLKKKIGFLPENNPLYEEMTVEEYLLFWAKIKGISKEEWFASKNFVVKGCAIKEVFYRPINTLSKGYRQRVGLAQAILTKPEILILDEPTEGLDPNQRKEIASLIKELGKERTVFVSSHVLGEIAKLVNRMIIIHKGKIVADDTPENLQKFGKTSQTIEAEIKGKEVLTTLKAIEEIKRVIRLKPNYYLIESKGNKDLREKIFNLAVRKKWILLTLKPKERAIEDVFSQLTKD